MSQNPASSPRHSPSSSLSSPANLDPDIFAAQQAQMAHMNEQGLALQRQLAESKAREAQLAQQLAVASAKGPRVKAPPLTPFTGAGGNLGAVVDTWLEDLQQQFDYYGPSEYPNDASKIRLATTYLRGTARTWWTQLSEVDLAAITTWEAFVEALHRRFRPALPAELARRKLKDLKQRGTVNMYAGLFQQILAYIPNKSEDDAIFDFRSGLDKAIAARVHVAEKEPKTLDEAIIIAVQAELYVGRGPTTSFTSNRGGFSQSSSSSSGSAPMELSNLNEDSYVEQEPAGITRNELLAALQAQKQEFLNALTNARSATGGKPASTSATKGPAKLTDAERDRCFKENLCLRCRGPGHRAAECPKFAANNRQDGRLNF